MLVRENDITIQLGQCWKDVLAIMLKKKREKILNQLFKSSHLNIIH